MRLIFLSIVLIFTAGYSTMNAQCKLLSSKVDPAVKKGYSKIEFSFGNSVSKDENIFLYLKNNRVEVKPTLRGSSGLFASFLVKPANTELSLYSGAKGSFCDCPRLDLKPGYTYRFKVKFEKVNIDELVAYKPVLYLYGDTMQHYTVDVSNPGRFKSVYPKPDLLQNQFIQWNIGFDPYTGIMHKGKNYPYLFWDAAMDPYVVSPSLYTSGAIISTDTLIDYLERTLEEIGFNSREKTDFITYWMPEMSLHPYVWVSMKQDNACNGIATYSIQPPLTNLNRLFMFWSPVSSPSAYSKLRGDSLIPFKRSGNYGVEWGGSKVPTFTTID
ncbi:MAG: hypothetical protein ACK5B6_10400 [Bacteroidia bacterium]|jgi:hypothetical protein